MKLTKNNNLQTLREKSDYNCFFNVTEQDIVDGIELAGQFIDAIEQLIHKKHKSDNHTVISPEP